MLGDRAGPGDRAWEGPGSPEGELGGGAGRAGVPDPPAAEPEKRGQRCLTVSTPFDSPTSS